MRRGVMGMKEMMNSYKMETQDLVSFLGKIRCLPCQRESRGVL